MHRTMSMAAILAGVVVLMSPGRLESEAPDTRAAFQEQSPSEGVRLVPVNGLLVVRDDVVEEGVFAGFPVRAPASTTQGRDLR